MDEELDDLHARLAAEGRWTMEYRRPGPPVDDPLDGDQSPHIRRLTMRYFQPDLENLYMRQLQDRVIEELLRRVLMMHNMAPYDRVATLFGVPIYQQRRLAPAELRFLMSEIRLRESLGMPFIPVNPALWAQYMNMTQEDVAALFLQLGLETDASRSMGIVPTREIGNALRKEVKTLRDRVFMRLFAAMNEKDKGVYELRLHLAGDNAFVIRPKGKHMTLKRVIAAARAVPACRRALSKIRFVQKGVGANHPNDELVAALQDLGDIIAMESTQVFKAEYYPGVSGMEWIPDEHVDAVMAAMQRELDREGMSRSKLPPVLMDLPMERKRALAERRRLWFGKYGITPKNWKRGTFSLWDVANEPLPEGVRFDPMPA